MLEVAVAFDPVELQIEGGRSDFAELGVTLRSGGSLDVSADFDPAPFDRALTHVVATLTDSGLVDVSIDDAGRSLNFRGGSVAMSDLADNVDGLANEADLGYHVHIEYYSEHPYLEESAQPFVLVLR